METEYLTIWKYELKLDYINVIEMPNNAKVVFVGVQGNELYLWAEVNSNSHKYEQREFIVHGTGDEFTHGGKYIGTAMMLDGTFVWHVYELKD